MANMTRKQEDPIEPDPVEIVERIKQNSEVLMDKSDQLLSELKAPKLHIKFKSYVRDLTKPIQLLSLVALKQAILDGTQSIHFISNGSGVYAEASRMSASARYYLDVVQDSKDHGEACVNAHQLFAIVKLMDDVKVTLGWTDKYASGPHLEATHGKSRNRFVIIDSRLDYFPPLTDKAWVVSLSADTLCHALERAIIACPGGGWQSDHLEHLKSVFFTAKDAQSRIFGTDSIYIAMTDMGAVDRDFEFGITVDDAKLLIPWLKSAGEDKVNFSLHDNTIQVSYPSYSARDGTIGPNYWDFRITLVSDPVPNLTKIIDARPTDPSFSIFYRDLAVMVKRCKLFSDFLTIKKSDQPSSIIVTAGALKSSGHEYHGEHTQVNQVTLGAEFPEKPVNIAIYILDQFLKSARGVESLTFKMPGHASPMLLDTHGDWYVIAMPALNLGRS